MAGVFDDPDPDQPAGLRYVYRPAAGLLCLLLSVRQDHPADPKDRSLGRTAGRRRIRDRVQRRSLYGDQQSGGHADPGSIELEKSDMLQKDLIANVSHDLRTPLTMIKSYAEMIKDISGNNPEKREEHLQVIIDEADRLNGLVNDLLTISRMQSGKMTSCSGQNFNITEAAADDSQHLPDHGGRGRLSRSSSTAPAPTSSSTATRTRSNRCISNLFTNAIKFCGEDKTVIITLRKTKADSSCAASRITASGIAPEELDHVWDRYYKASSNMVRATEGTGLGLSIVKEILTLHKVNYRRGKHAGSRNHFLVRAQLREDGKRKTCCTGAGGSGIEDPTPEQKSAADHQTGNPQPDQNQK